MDNKTLEKLNYDKIISLLAKEASSLQGKKMCLSLLPYNNISTTNEKLDETCHALDLLRLNIDFSFNNLKSLDDVFSNLTICRTLSIADLYNILSLFDLTNRYIKVFNNNNIPCDNLLKIKSQNLANCPFLHDNLKKTINNDHEILDTASISLKETRNKINNIKDEIHSTLTNLLRGPLSPYLQDHLITIKENRYCLCIKAEYINQIDGIVHSVSSSGSSCFIEPAQIINLENKLRNLYVIESQEITKILEHLTDICKENIEIIKNNYNILSFLDFSFAKAKFAVKINASKPIISNNIYIKEARHPLINKEKVVPIDIIYENDINQLIVTGPNTGGKTVLLKTLGLITLMAKSGLFIPAREGSKVKYFNEIFIDIGDEQSIEQSLSTFSSHMSNIISFINLASENSLVLIDEICAGTDPNQGSALSIAILKYLLKKNCYVLATTHYSDLKIYAITNNNVTNASLEFDSKSLLPTYKVLIGTPGKSNAFEISRKLGLPDDIVNLASKELTTEEKNLESLYASLEEKNSLLTKNYEEITKNKKDIEALKTTYVNHLNEINKNKNKILEKARIEAAEIISSAKTISNNLIKEAKDLSIKDSASSSKKEANKMLHDLSSFSSPTKSNSKIKPKKSELIPGRKVHINSMNLNGIISSNVDNKNMVYIKTGIIKSKVNIYDLELIDDDSVPSYKSKNNLSSFSKAGSISAEINLIGLNSIDAIYKLEKYIDDCYSSNISQIRIIHGKGTGILRNAVHEFLKKCPQISSFNLAEYGDGDSGATIAILL